MRRLDAGRGPGADRDGQALRRLARILVRASIDEHRRPWHRERPTDELPDLPAQAPDPGLRDSLVGALLQLPPMQRKAVVLRHWLGLSVEETARELGIAQGTVKTHCSRGLERLQLDLTREER